MQRILLIDPKSPFNVGGALRACHIYDASSLTWTGERVLDRLDAAELTLRSNDLTPRRKLRLPREERLKEYNDVPWQRLRLPPEELPDHLRRAYQQQHIVPVCVEVLPQAEPLPLFRHPPRATYLFGPEDGSVPAPVRAACHRFLYIPAPNRTPLNLAVAINMVLADRYVKGAFSHAR